MDLVITIIVLEVTMDIGDNDILRSHTEFKNMCIMCSDSEKVYIFIFDSNCGNWTQRILVPKVPYLPFTSRSNFATRLSLYAPLGRSASQKTSALCDRPNQYSMILSYSYVIASLFHKGIETFLKDKKRFSKI